MNSKEFDRSVCFQFYESYLEQGKLVKEQLGAEMCAEYFIALATYGLYQKESDNPMIKMIITGLKNTIDAGQLKRSKGFTGENKEQTETILLYIQEHPEASQRDIANACNCSLGKVNKVINSNLNSNNNINNNSNSNTNSMNVNVNTEEVRREIKDLTEKEAEEIISKIHRKVKYLDIQKEYNLSEFITKDFEKQWYEIRKAKREEQLTQNAELYEEFASYLGRELEMVKTAFTNVPFLRDRNITDIIDFCRQYPEYSFDSWCMQHRDQYSEYDPEAYAKSQNKYILFFKDKLCNFNKN